MTQVVLALLTSPSQAQDHGFAEVRAGAYAGVEGRPWRVTWTARPSFHLDVGESFSLSATPLAEVVMGRSDQGVLQDLLDGSDYADLFDLADCGWADANDGLFRPIRSSSDWLSVERLHADLHTGPVDVRVGRQAIQWGSSLFVRPTDPFPQVLLLSPWAQREGVNAAKVTTTAERVEVQAVGGLDDSLRKYRAAGRLALHLEPLDAALAAAWRQDAQNGFVGVDLRGSAVVGWWAEGSIHLGTEQSPYEELALGVDYSFPVLSGLVFGVQYYRNGAGATTPRAYDLTGYAGEVVGPECSTAEATRTFAIGDGKTFEPFFAGRDYIQAQAQLDFGRGFLLRAGLVQNARDGSGVGVPWLTWRPGGRFEWSAAAQLPYHLWGKEGEFWPSPEMLVYTSPSPVGGTLAVDLDPLVASVSITSWIRVWF